MTLTTNGAATAAPASSASGQVIPFVPQCRRCKRPAVRYLGGSKKKTYYCEEHGPTQTIAWTRLVPIPHAEKYEHAPRIPSLTAPLPVQYARLIDSFSESLRELIAEGGHEALHALEVENARLKAELERIRLDLAAAEEVAAEAIELLPGGPPDAPAAPATGPAGAGIPEFGPETALGRPISPEVAPEPMPEPIQPVSGPTERDLPQPRPGPTPGAPSDVPSFPPPIMPEREPERGSARETHERGKRHKKHKGYTVEPKAAAGEVIEDPEPGEAARTLRGMPEGWVQFTATDIELYSLQTLVRRMTLTERSPGLGITRRALKDYTKLSTFDKRSILDAMQYMSLAPENLQETKMTASGSEGTYTLRASRRLRIVVTKPRARYYAIERIVGRGDVDFYKRER